MIEICSLSSGSSGNAFFIKTGEEAFLIDAGISCRQLFLRLAQIQKKVEDIHGIFITHEHLDHVKGLRVLLKNFPIPVYITEKTYQRINFNIEEFNLNIIKSMDSIRLNSTTIQSLPKYHDAVDPSLFSFYYKNKKISFITDTGDICNNVISAVRDANVIFLESNYDETMLWKGFYPPYLKERINSNLGHLSNNQAANLIQKYASPHLEYIFLSHISENNNTPDIVLNTFQSIIKKRNDLRKLTTILTSRYEASPLIRL